VMYQGAMPIKFFPSPGLIGIYIEKCASCHRPDGHGNDALAPSKALRPRDFGNVQIQDDT